MGTIAVVGERKPLDDAFEVAESDLFLLCGGAGSIAERIYSEMKKLSDAQPDSWDGWQHIFLIRENKLTGPERPDFPATPSEHYVVLRGPGAPKSPVRSGPVSQLLTDGAPDILKIVDAFLS